MRRTIAAATTILALAATTQAQAQMTPSGGAMTPSAPALQTGTGVAAALANPANSGGGVVTAPVGGASLGAGAATLNLGFTPLNPADNLSDVASPAIARTNLGLGALSTLTSCNGPAVGSGASASCSWTMPGSMQFNSPYVAQFNHINVGTEAGDPDDLVVLDNVYPHYTGFVVEPNGTPTSDPFAGYFLNISQGTNQEQLAILANGIAQNFTITEILTGTGSYVPIYIDNNALPVMEIDTNPYLWVPTRLTVGTGLGGTWYDRFQVSRTNGYVAAGDLLGTADFGLTIAAGGGLTWRVADSGANGNLYVYDATNNRIPFTIAYTAPANSLSLGAGAVSVGSLLQLGVVYSAAGTALPSCTSTLAGSLAYVSDAASPTYNGPYTSGGTVKTLVLCNGSSWTTH